MKYSGSAGTLEPELLAERGEVVPEPDHLGRLASAAAASRRRARPSSPVGVPARRTCRLSKRVMRSPSSMPNDTSPPWRNRTQRCVETWTLMRRVARQTSPIPGTGRTSRVRRRTTPLMAMRTGGRLIVDALVANGVDAAFCVPGESYIAVLDALHDAPSIRMITCRHEAAAAHMAEATGKLTGRPGIALVTRGPGATHATIGVHIARQDSTPMILFVGQVERSMQGREAFQELDYGQVFGGLAKWAAQIDDARRIPELVSRAFHVAMSGRPGPVVLALPEDVLREEADVAGLARAERVARIRTRRSGAHARDARASESADRDPRRQRLGRGRVRCDGALRRAQRAAGGVLVPPSGAVRQPASVLCGRLEPRSQPRARGTGTRRRPLLAIGTRLGETPMQGYTLLEAPRSRQKLVHVHADPDELGRVYEADLAINAGPAEFARALDAIEPVPDPAWTASTAKVRAAIRGRATSRANRAPRSTSRTSCTSSTTSSGRRDPVQRRGELRGLAASLLSLQALRHADRARRGCDGVRSPGGDRRQAAPSRAHRARVRGRRRVPHDGLRPRDGGAVRHRRRRDRRQQRDVRNDPHAPGEGLSGPRRRDRPAQPGLRRVRPRVRRARRARRAHGRLSGGVRSRARRERARAARAAHGPRADHAAHDASRALRDAAKS